VTAATAAIGVVASSAALVFSGVVDLQALAVGPRVIAAVLLGQGAATAAVLTVLYQRVPAGQRAAALSLAQLPARTLGAVAAISLLLIPLAALVNGVVLYGARQLGWSPPPNPVIQWLGSEPLSTVIILLVCATVVAPLAEELLFRQVLCEALTDCIGRVPAVHLTAAAFAVSHGQPQALPALYLLGICLQAARQRTGSLWGAIVMHAVFNTIMVGLALLARHMSGGA
jgi:membrane protease YdiL (CAAX protease family)